MIKCDWEWDLLLGEWVFVATVGDDGQHYWACKCGRSDPSTEPGYLDYLKTKATKVFREKGVL